MSTEDILLWAGICILIASLAAFIVYREVRYRKVLMHEREKWAERSIENR